MKRRILRGIKGVGHGLSNLILRAIGESLEPRWLMFAVTDRCNSRCRHCDIWRKEPTKDPLEPKEIERMLSDPLFQKVEYILNSGGEPTIRDDLEEIFLAEHEALPKARLQLSTNGLLPERAIEVVKFSINHGISIDVGISVDGIGEKHDFVRGVKGNFEKVDWLLHELAAMKESYKDKLGIAVGFVLSDLTLPSMEEVRTYLRKFDIEPLVQWYNEAPFYGNIGENHATEVDNLIKAVESLPCSQLYELWLRQLRGKSIKIPCFAMYTFCALHCNGDMVPCLRFWDIKVGNVRQSSPTSIWHSPEAKKARRAVKDCQGCLNAWGVGWSLQSAFYPHVLFFLRHQHAVARSLRNK